LLHLTHHNDYIFHLKKPPAEWGELRPHETAMLQGMFFMGDPRLTAFTGQSQGMRAFEAIMSTVGPRGIRETMHPPGPASYSGMFGGSSQADVQPVDPTSLGPDTSVSLSDMQNRFYVHLPGIRSSITEALVKDGYYLRSPDSVRQGYVAIGGVLGFLLFMGSGFLASATTTSSVAWVIAAIAIAVIVASFGWFMPAHTVTGVRTLEKVLGFEDFLGRVEGDKIRRLETTPELFQKYLPYAMALRVDKKWAQQFAGIAMQPPQWYQGSYGPGFMPYLLVNDLNMMSMQTGSAMASAPRSSGGTGGSGFGGGGGSGGGFGGGSVGGF
jgi:hypothetical protein